MAAIAGPVTFTAVLWSHNWPATAALQLNSTYNDKLEIGQNPWLLLHFKPRVHLDQVKSLGWKVRRRPQLFYSPVWVIERSRGQQARPTGENNVEIANVELFAKVEAAVHWRAPARQQTVASHDLGTKANGIQQPQKNTREH